MMRQKHKFKARVILFNSDDGGRKSKILQSVVYRPQIIFNYLADNKTIISENCRFNEKHLENQNSNLTADGLFLLESKYVFPGEEFNCSIEIYPHGFDAVRNRIKKGNRIVIKEGAKIVGSGIII